jgi:hypothetical protein
MNSICLNCQCLHDDCKGTNNSAWTGCIFRKPIKVDENLCSQIPIIPRETLEAHNVLISKLPVYKGGVA